MFLDTIDISAIINRHNPRTSPSLLSLAVASHKKLGQNMGARLVVYLECFKVQSLFVALFGIVKLRHIYTHNDT